MVCYSTLYKIINAKVLGIYSIEWCPRVIVGAQRTNQDFISRRTQVLEYWRIDPRLPTRFFTNFSTASSQKWITNCSLHGSQCSRHNDGSEETNFFHPPFPIFSLYLYFPIVASVIGDRHKISGFIFQILVSTTDPNISIRTLQLSLEPA